LNINVEKPNGKLLSYSLSLLYLRFFLESHRTQTAIDSFKRATDRVNPYFFTGRELELVIINRLQMNGLQIKHIFKIFEIDKTLIRRA